MFLIPDCGLLLNFAHKLIQLSIPILGYIESLAEKHVLHAIQTIEHSTQNAFTKILHQIKKDLFAPLEDQLA
jgi:hypothetical protein